MTRTAASSPRHPGLAASAAALALLLPHADAAAQGAGQRPKIKWAEGRLSVEVGAMPVLAVLEEIGRATGAEVTGRGELGSTTPQSFEALPLEAALRRLVGANGIVVLYQPGAEPGAEARVAAIRVYETALESREAQAPERGAAGQRAAAPPGDARARASRVRELVQAGDDQAVGELQQILTSGGDARERRPIVDALVTIGTPRAAEALTAALRDQEPEIRSQAAQGVWSITGAGSADVLQDALAVERDPDVRRVLERLLDRTR
jgi:hypothetical protein